MQSGLKKGELIIIGADLLSESPLSHYRLLITYVPKLKSQLPFFLSSYLQRNLHFYWHIGTINTASIEAEKFLLRLESIPTLDNSEQVKNVKKAS